MKQLVQPGDEVMVAKGRVKHIVKRTQEYTRALPMLWCGKSERKHLLRTTVYRSPLCKTCAKHLAKDNS